MSRGAVKTRGRFAYEGEELDTSKLLQGEVQLFIAVTKHDFGIVFYTRVDLNSKMLILDSKIR